MALVWRMQRKLATSISISRVKYCSSASVRDSSHGITRRNFPSALQQLKRLLRDADFVALDLEMSGMHSAPWRKSMELDTVETRYQNMRDSAEKFSVFQCGVCLFRYDDSAAKFFAYPYNFFLFPRNELCVERDYLCQTSSLEFLAKHNFDFNACVYNGISYLSRTEEKKIREQLEKGVGEDGKVPELLLRRTSDVMFSERVRLEVGLWRTAKIMAKHKSKAETKTDATGQSPEDKMSSLLVNVADKRQAKLVVQAVTSNFDDTLAMFDDDNEDVTQVKVIFTGSVERKNSLEAGLKKAKEDIMETDLSEAVGFRHVIDAISDSKKPIIGHNCVLDLAHIHSKFIGPLPEKYSTFCSTIHELFPAIIDTKYMLKALPAMRHVGISRTSLYPVYAYFSGVDTKQKEKKKNRTFPRVEVEVVDGFCKYTNVDLKHEAGFDAYMTGTIFAQMWRLITSSPSELQSLQQKIRRGIPGVADYANLLYMGWAGHYVLDLSSGKEARGTKALPERSCYASYRPASDAAVIVWSQGAVGSARHLQKLVRTCFSGTDFSSEVEVVPIDENAAFLAFKKVSSMEEFSRAFESIEANEEQQSPIATKLAASGLQVTRFETFEKLCKSQLSNRKLADAIQMLKEYEEEEEEVEVREIEVDDPETEEANDTREEVIMLA